MFSQLRRGRPEAIVGDKRTGLRRRTDLLRVAVGTCAGADHAFMHVVAVLPQQRARVRVDEHVDDLEAGAGDGLAVVRKMIAVGQREHHELGVGPEELT